MPTLVLSPRYCHDTESVRHAALHAGWDVERLLTWRAPDWLRDFDPVLYGEPLFAAVVAEALDLALLEPTQDWLITLPDEFLIRQIRYGTLGEARMESRAFIKPADDKCFTAKVYERGSEIPDSDALTDATPVLISEPVHWTLEFRSFILERELLTISPYLRDGELCQDTKGQWVATETELSHAEGFIHNVLADERVALPPAVVIDVGLIAKRGWAVVEANAAWGSGIYGCDPDRVLKVIRRACIDRDAVTASERRWLPERL